MEGIVSGQLRSCLPRLTFRIIIIMLCLQFAFHWDDRAESADQNFVLCQWWRSVGLPCWTCLRLLILSTTTFCRQGHIRHWWSCTVLTAVVPDGQGGMCPAQLDAVHPTTVWTVCQRGPDWIRYSLSCVPPASLMSSRATDSIYTCMPTIHRSRALAALGLQTGSSLPCQLA